MGVVTGSRRALRLGTIRSTQTSRQGLSADSPSGVSTYGRRFSFPLRPTAPSASDGKLSPRLCLACIVHWFDAEVTCGPVLHRLADFEQPVARSQDPG